MKAETLLLICALPALALHYVALIIYIWKNWPRRQEPDVVETYLFHKKKTVAK